jgi:hypothetical protein
MIDFTNPLHPKLKVLPATDAGKPQITQTPPSLPAELERAEWIADIARLTDCRESLREPLGKFYDLAHSQGVSAGIDRLAARILEKPV